MKSALVTGAFTPEFPRERRTIREAAGRGD
jgi:hypothetical protein